MRRPEPMEVGGAKDRRGRPTHFFDLVRPYLRQCMGESAFGSQLLWREVAVTNTIAKSNALEQWRPDFGTLPDGWRMVRCDIRVDFYVGPEAEVEFAHGPRHRPCQIRVRANPKTADVREWLFPLMEHVVTLGHETSVEVDARVSHYGYYGR